MKLPIRLENAITKLYTAFHSGELRLANCEKCAVGNICDNNGEWFSPIIKIKNSIYRKVKYFEIDENKTIQKTGYSAFELSNIETIFANTVNYADGKKNGWTLETKETQFKGLCAVVEYLCQLDNIPNVMDYTKLFETENDKPKYQLNTI